MRPRIPRVLDSSALVALFEGHPELGELLDQAEAGWFNILLPTTAIADAESQVRAGMSGWDGVLLVGGVSTLPLVEHAAIEIGAWPGSLPVRHAVHEAYAMRATVVTRAPDAYDGHLVPLLVV